ncbi:hypothetical protein QBC37DRAFT_435170 [Rhypophila decipiens]|uniref:Uncharacterized protein n=1 Tax=Rhypophila decipiens TaxID=261697 RepID=A0AAN6XXD7_9PEZI|nr:hypothetical protein QBC37DRAFT_435170 [Rhypophila decipiens]
MKYHLTSTLALLLATGTLSAAEVTVPTSPAPTGAAVAARQVPPTVTVTGSLGDLINKADHDGDDDSEQFKSGVGSFLSKATSVVGDAFKPTTGTGTGTSTPAAATGAGGQRNGAGKISVPGRDGLGVMVSLAGLVGAGVMLL